MNLGDSLHHQVKLAAKLLSLQVFWYFSIKNGSDLLYPFIGLALLIIDVFMFRPKSFMRYLIFSILLVSLGLVMDKAFDSLGFLIWGNNFYPNQLLSVWIIFPCYYSLFYERFKSSLLLPFIIGAIFGPFAYVSGGRISDVIRTTNDPVSLIIMGVFWGLFFVVSVGMYGKIMKGMEQHEKN